MLRRTGPRRVHIVQVGGGPLGGDDLALDVEVGAGQTLCLRSAAATVVQPGPRPGAEARLHVAARLGPGAVLDWGPEPTVVTDRARWSVRLAVDLADGARLRLREQVVLGRSGQVGGRARTDLAITHDGRPLLRTSTLLDGADPALTGPGGTAGARSVGSFVLAGDHLDPVGSGDAPDLTWAWTSLDGPGALLTAVGEVRAVGAVLDREGQLAGSTCFPSRSVERQSEQMCPSPVADASRSGRSRS